MSILSVPGVTPGTIATPTACAITETNTAPLPCLVSVCPSAATSTVTALPSLAVAVRTPAALALTTTTAAPASNPADAAAASTSTNDVPLAGNVAAAFAVTITWAFAPPVSRSSGNPRKKIDALT